ncbi:PREDICTED: exonuclease 1 [Nicotiana attenuata]|uniref:Exonuclease 1 n=1 Tax=Nicotiana attenuata TaxID=49451 RepID=A0A314KMI5_NICAT|nr:PREDICTED: exonuclease 1 [Nicotiana attenuata]OIT30671.1 exonuclease 1 [Nicotiana attenuata]
MGIKDLLRFMKPYVEPVHIKKYAGKRVGIDAYCWLHKGAYSCSMELCLNLEGDKKLQYLNYFMHRINLLRHYKITPVVVFDGGNLPCKSGTEEERHRRRKTNRDQAMLKLKEGNVAGAVELFQRAVSVTPSMAHQLIQILKSENIEFVVAPYEADAQLAYLSSLEEEKSGIVAVISEDSDLLAYGCPAVFFKMDSFGNGQEVVLDQVFSSATHVPSFRHLNKDLFTGMCVLAGCDFLPSVPGIGITKAYNLVSKYRDLDRVLSMLKFEKGDQVPEDYTKSFKEAVAVFHHARIYDVSLKQTKHLKPVPEQLLQFLDEELDFLGPEILPSLATAIAQGSIDPCTMEAFDLFPNMVNHVSTANIKRICGPFSRQQASAQASKDSSFIAISSSKTRKETTVVETKQASDEQNQCPFMDDRECIEEAVALQNLLCPSISTRKAVGKEKKSQQKEVLKVPDNNPFRKRKVEEIEPDELESVTEQISEVTEVESLEVVCTTPESQKSVESKPIKRIELRRVTNERKVKRSNCQSSENKKNSILNFFSRV